LGLNFGFSVIRAFPFQVVLHDCLPCPVFCFASSLFYSHVSSVGGNSPVHLQASREYLNLRLNTLSTCETISAGGME